jgi:thiol:disulfide interchange protein DsbC
MRNIVALVVSVSLSMISSSVFSGEKEITNALLKAVPQIQIKEIRPSKISGMYEVEDQTGQILFSNEDGSYLITGELYSTTSGSLQNLSEQRRQEARMGQLSSVTANEKITFPAKGETKAKIAIFTDIDCGYCRKLHTEVPRMNELGIEVSYLAFPRAGVGSSSYDKAVSVWCADDRLKAMTDAKAGRSVASATCDNPVAKEYNLGNQMGVTGTPAILLEDGTLVPGYVPADQLAQGLGIL